MYIMYLDHSGSATHSDEHQYCVLAGLAVFERQIWWLNQEMNNLQTRYFPAEQKPVEFHAQHIYKGKGRFRKIPEDERTQILNDVYQVLARANRQGVKLFAVALHLASLQEPEQPYERSFEELCQRVDLYSRRVYRQGTTTKTPADPRQRWMVILDKSHLDRKLTDLGLMYQAIGTRWGMFANSVEVPLFVDSSVSRLMQLADFVAYAVFQYYEHGQDGLLAQILDRFDQDSGRIHGLVHLIPGYRSCACPACTSRRSTLPTPAPPPTPLPE